MAKFNHMLDVAFEVISEKADGSDITPVQIHAAIAKRLVSLAESNEYDDANIGINWEVIDACAYYLYPQEERA
jgi:hypothetical protein